MKLAGTVLVWVVRLLALPVLTEAAMAQPPEAEPPSPISRMADGRPDLQGVWEFRWRTFLVRPPGAPAIARDAAEADLMVERQKTFFRALPGNGNPESDLDLTTLVRVNGEYRMSLIVDPPSGQIPWLESERMALPRPTDKPIDDPEERAPNERCIAMQTFPVIPIPTNNYVQVIQPPGAVVMIPEALGEIRRLAPGVAREDADVSSRWEGDTLVVESRNFFPALRFTQPMTMVGFSGATSVRESFTPVSRDEILYRFTITDPTLYSHPWTVETAWVRSRERLFEYACHEGNYALTNMLQGGRARDGAPPR